MMHLPLAEKALDEQLSKLMPLLGFVTIFSILGAVAGFMALFGNQFGLADDFLSQGWNRLMNPMPPQLDLFPKKTTFQTTILKASDHNNDHKHHLLLAATGSVATIKIPNIIQALSKHPNLSIRLLLTKSASEFLQAQSSEQPSLTEIAKLPNVDGIYFDEDEWRKPWVRGDSILHIELRRWADLMLIAPLSANSLAKISQGLSDNLTTSVVRAWDFSGLIDGARPGIPLSYRMQKSEAELRELPEQFRQGRKKGIIVAPAMNTAMWSHPVTAKQIAALEDEWGVGNGGWFEVLRPVEKTLACGDTGSGAMRDWKDIVNIVEERLLLQHSREDGEWEKA